MALTTKVPSRSGPSPAPVPRDAEAPQRLRLMGRVAGVTRPMRGIGVVIGGFAQPAREFMFPAQRDQRARIDGAGCVLLRRAGTAVAH